MIIYFNIHQSRNALKLRRLQYAFSGLLQAFFVADCFPIDQVYQA